MSWYKGTLVAAGLSVANPFSLWTGLEAGQEAEAARDADLFCKVEASRLWSAGQVDGTELSPDTGHAQWFIAGCRVGMRRAAEVFLDGASATSSGGNES